MSIACLLTTHVVVATPGTGAVYSTAARLSRGSRAGIIAAFGCTLGVLPHIVAATTRLAAILHASAIAFQVIKWLGVAYFLHHLFEAVKRRLPIRRGRFHRRNQDAGFDQPVPHHLQRPVVVLNVRVSARRPPRGPGVRTHTVTESLPTSRPATRSNMTSIGPSPSSPVRRLSPNGAGPEGPLPGHRPACS
jgi:hypothetical protein